MTCPSVENKGQNMESYQIFYLYSVLQLRPTCFKKMFNSLSRVDKLINVLGNKRGTHFNTKDLESMGYHFCDSLLDYCDPDRTKVSKVHLVIDQPPVSEIMKPACRPTAVLFLYPNSVQWVLALDIPDIYIQLV